MRHRITPQTITVVVVVVVVVVVAAVVVSSFFLLFLQYLIRLLCKRPRSTLITFEVD